MKTNDNFIAGSVTLVIAILIVVGTVMEKKLMELSSSSPWCQEDFHFSKDNPILLTSKGLGPLQYSITESDFRSICPTAADTIWFDGEGNEISGTSIIFGTKNIGYATWRQQKLHRIYITDPWVITEYGIGVNSSLGKIRKVWGELKAGYDDAGVYMWSEDESFITYLIDANIFDILPVPDDVSNKPEVVPDSSTVKRIIFISRYN